jgi:two-component system NtrC family sensor kinase
MKILFRHIGLKLIIAISIATILIIGAYAYFNVRSQSMLMLDEISRHVDQQSETIKSGTKYAMLSYSPETIHHIIQTIGIQPSIQEIRVLNKDGEIIYSSDTTQIGVMLDKKAEACYTCHASNQPMERLDMSERTRIYQVHPDSSRLFGVINPIYNEPSCWQSDCHVHPADKKVLGVLDMTFDLQEMDDQISLVKLKMVIFALFAIASLGMVLWLFVRIWINKPLQGLVTATHQVASGNLSYTIGNLSYDELGDLAQSFNHMTQKLSEARMQLFQSDKLASLGRLAAGVAHEINNPLTGILTYSSFLLKRAVNQPELQADLEVIVRETKRSREIVKSLLDFARQSVPKKSAADIHEIINRALGLLDNQIGVNHVIVNKKYDPSLPALTADSNQLQQVFTNLIANANDAIGPGGGAITIQTKRTILQPFGSTQIKQALCPKGHELMDHELKIGGAPSIRVRGKSQGAEGYIHIDPVYGKNRNHYGFQVGENESIDVSCSKCNMSLMDASKKCPACGDPIYVLEIPGKGRFEGCLKKGGEWQYWEIIEQEGGREYIEINIEDTGCGIPKENLQKIFEPFYTTKGQKGTGLGLAVIWGIVDNHDGAIFVKSEVGAGATFTVQLPVIKK